MSSIDLATMVQANSDQVNAADLVQPVTVTITRLEHGPDEKQKLNVYTDIFGEKPWRPCLTVRRLISKVWGTDGPVFIGRSLTIYNDPTVTFGRDTTGGIRVSHMSHIDSPVIVKLPVRRGQMGTFTVDPIPSGPPLVTDEVAGQFAADILAAGNVQALDAISVELKKHNLGNHRADLLAAFTARKAELNEAAS